MQLLTLRYSPRLRRVNYVVCKLQALPCLIESLVNLMRMTMLGVCYREVGGMSNAPSGFTAALMDMVSFAALAIFMTVSYSGTS